MEVALATWEGLARTAPRTTGGFCPVTLELVEPELYFRHAPEAAQRLAGGIEALCRL